MSFYSFFPRLYDSLGGLHALLEGKDAWRVKLCSLSQEAVDKLKLMS